MVTLIVLTTVVNVLSGLVHSITSLLDSVKDVVQGGANLDFVGLVVGQPGVNNPGLPVVAMNVGNPMGGHSLLHVGAVFETRKIGRAHV